MEKENKNISIEKQAEELLLKSRHNHQSKQVILWIAALVIGGILGGLGNTMLNQMFAFIATVFTRLFQFIAIPTISLTVITTLASIGVKKDTGRIFVHALTYTLLTTICAAAIGLALYIVVDPGNLPVSLVNAGVEPVSYTHLTLPTTPYV